MTERREHTNCPFYNRHPRPSLRASTRWAALEEGGNKHCCEGGRAFVTTAVHEHGFEGRFFIGNSSSIQNERRKSCRWSHRTLSIELVLFSVPFPCSPLLLLQLLTSYHQGTGDHWHPHVCCCAVVFCFFSCACSGQEQTTPRQTRRNI